MRKTIICGAAAAAILGVVSPTMATAQSYGVPRNPQLDYVPPPPYASQPRTPSAYAAPYARPRVNVTPGYGYGSGAWFDYRHFGDPTTRDSLATCAYC